MVLAILESWVIWDAAPLKSWLSPSNMYWALLCRHYNYLSFETNQRLFHRVEYPFLICAQPLLPSSKLSHLLLAAKKSQGLFNLCFLGKEMITGNWLFKKYHWCPITECIWLLQATVSKDHQWEGLGGQCQIEKGNATFPALFTKSNSYNAVTNNTSVTPELQNDWVQVKHMQLDPVYVCNHYWTTVQHY